MKTQIHKKYIIDKRPNFKNLLIHWKWKVLQRIFWYCSARKYYRISNFIRENTKLNDTGFHTSNITIHTKDEKFKIDIT